jgi:hypothetical protein
MTTIIVCFDRNHFAGTMTLIILLLTYNTMKLFIGKESKAEDLKNLFTLCYPYLKIEFFKKPSVINVLDKKDAATVNRFESISGSALIDIDKNITVGHLENDFALLGLKAEVFRRCGNVWVETSLTEGWTLHQQNLEGEEISRQIFC